MNYKLPVSVLVLVHTAEREVLLLERALRPGYWQSVTGSLDRRVIEYVDHLHEHFVDPVTIKGGRYMPPVKPGYSIEMKAESLREYAFPGGAAWRW